MGFYLEKKHETNFWLNKRNQKGFKGKCQELICWVAKYSPWHIFTKSTRLIIVNCGVLLNVFPIQYILFLLSGLCIPSFESVSSASPSPVFNWIDNLHNIYKKKAKHSLATIYIQQARTGKPTNTRSLFFCFYFDNLPSMLGTPASRLLPAESKI